MPIDLTRPLAWTQADAQELLLLQNLQGNILKGHGRERTTNIFFRFGPDVPASRQALRDIAVQHVTDALTQLEAAETRNQALAADQPPVDGGTFGAAFLSTHGYAALGIPFEAPPGNDAFDVGMSSPASIADLQDPKLLRWEDKFQSEIHGMILIADDDAARGDAAAGAVVARLAAAGATTFTQAGATLRDDKGNGIEHFGYVDGRSQPLLLAEDIAREPRAVWDPAFPLTAALVRDPAVQDESAFGSFFVFRKLEQDVAGFKAREQDLADALNLTGDDRERAGALVVGRFEDGTPATVAALPADVPPENDFDYSADRNAARCPFHAHIRKTNPRGTGGFELEPAERAHLMPRRGIPFEDVPRAVPPRALPEAKSRAEFEANVLPLLPSGGVGLLFMAYNSRLDDQFVFTQRTWANNRGFPQAPLAPGSDGVIGQDHALPPQGKSYLRTWGRPADGGAVLDFGGFVTMKGGAYFFAPSLAFFRGL